MRSFLVTLALLFLACCQNANSWRHGHRRHEVTQSPDHAEHESRVPELKEFTSGSGYRIKSPHASKSYSCEPSAKVKEIKFRGFYRWEYNMVVNEFEHSEVDNPTKLKIIKVEKVFNGCWMRRYNYRQKQIDQELASEEFINEASDSGEEFFERMLFHGTSGEVDGQTGAQIVAQKGFDEKFGKKGDDFGPGLYFSGYSYDAHNRSKANSQGLREMIVARVTLGQMHRAEAKKKFTHPPPGTHSVVYDTTYVIYRGEQAYPDYIVTYEEVTDAQSTEGQESNEEDNEAQ